MRISDWSSDVCSSDLINEQGRRGKQVGVHGWIGRELRKGGPDRLVQTENVNHFARTSLVELPTYRGGTVEIPACLPRHSRSPATPNLPSAPRPARPAPFPTPPTPPPPPPPPPPLMPPPHTPPPPPHHPPPP